MDGYKAGLRLKGMGIPGRTVFYGNYYVVDSHDLVEKDKLVKWEREELNLHRI